MKKVYDILNKALNDLDVRFQTNDKKDNFLVGFTSRKNNVDFKVVILPIENLRAAQFITPLFVNIDCIDKISEIHNVINLINQNLLYGTMYLKQEINEGNVTYDLIHAHSICLERNVDSLSKEEIEEIFTYLAFVVHSSKKAFKEFGE